MVAINALVHVMRYQFGLDRHHWSQCIIRYDVLCDRATTQNWLGAPPLSFEFA